MKVPPFFLKRRGCYPAPRKERIMTCTSPFSVKVEDREVIVPCGRCRACRIRRSAEWMLRLYHESLYHEESVFITLTYDNEHLPSDMQLNKTHLQSFIKMLREAMAPRRIKYYGSGEYGDDKERPHYHLIVFGLGYDECEYDRFYDPRRRRWYSVVKSGVLLEAWRKGNITVGTAEKDSMRYVADYIQKRLYDDEADKDGRVQPFSLMSKGLGIKYAKDHKEDIVRLNGCFMNGVKVGMPRYYVKVLELEGEFVPDEKEDRVSRSKDSKEFWRRSEQYDKNLKAKSDNYRKGGI